MEPALGVAGLWIVFAGAHIGFATEPFRGRLVARLGEGGFNLLFSVVASLSFAWLVHYYAAHQFDGARGLGLADVAAVRWPLMAVTAAAFALLGASLLAYPRSPYALFNRAAARVPRGVERITRHPFFASVAVLALAHTPLARQLIGAVFLGGLAVFSIAGAWHQDRKLLASRGQPYADYLAATSAVPFAAILAGRQALVWRELPWPALAGGVVLAMILRAVHGSIFAAGGAWVIGAIVGGAALETLQSWRRAQRRNRRMIGAANH